MNMYIDKNLEPFEPSADLRLYHSELCTFAGTSTEAQVQDQSLRFISPLSRVIPLLHTTYSPLTK